MSYFEEPTERVQIDRNSRAIDLPDSKRCLLCTFGAQDTIQVFTFSEGYAVVSHNKGLSYSALAIFEVEYWNSNRHQEATEEAFLEGESYDIMMEALGEDDGMADIAHSLLQYIQ